MNDDTIFLELPDLSKLTDKEKEVYKFISQMRFGATLINDAISELEINNITILATHGKLILDLKELMKKILLELE